MGYTTIFEGQLEPNKPLQKEIINKINDINPYNNYYYKIKHENYGINDYLHNRSYKKKIGSGIDSYCDWIYNEEENVIEWSGGEKFYGYILWLKFILNIVNTETDCKFNGVIRWMGENIEDIGLIKVINNEIQETDYIINELKNEEYLLI